jgi:hypothetical protein
LISPGTAECTALPASLCQTGRAAGGGGDRRSLIHPFASGGGDEWIHVS